MSDVQGEQPKGVLNELEAGAKAILQSAETKIEQIFHLDGAATNTAGHAVPLGDAGNVPTAPVGGVSTATSAIEPAAQGATDGDNLGDAGNAGLGTPIPGLADTPVVLGVEGSGSQGISVVTAPGAGDALLVRWHREMSLLGRGLSAETEKLIKDTAAYLGL